jgi:hypothetical protein
MNVRRIRKALTEADIVAISTVPGKWSLDQTFGTNLWFNENIPVLTKFNAVLNWKLGHSKAARKSKWVI